MLNRPYRILIFSPAFAPLNGPEAIVNNKLCSIFLKYGLSVDVVSRDSSQFVTTSYTSSNRSGWKELEPSIHEVVYAAGGMITSKIDTAFSLLQTGRPVEGVRWAARAYKIGMQLHTQNPYDIILSRASPDAANIPAMMMKRITGLPWIANWNDPSDVMPSREYGGTQKHQFGYFHGRLLREAARRADWHTFPSARLRAHAFSYLKNIEMKSSVIPHPSLEQGEANANDHTGQFILCHAGDLSAERDPETFFQSIARLTEKPEIAQSLKIWIIGEASEESRTLARKYSIEPFIEWKGHFSYHETMNLLAQCSVLFIVEAPSIEGIFLPSKFTDYVQTGKPILSLSPKTGTLHDILSEHGGGIAADCTSTESTTSALNELFDAWRDGRLQKQYGSARLFQLFSPEKIMSEYTLLFSKLIPRRVM